MSAEDVEMTQARDGVAAASSMQADANSAQGEAKSEAVEEGPHSHLAAALARVALSPLDFDAHTQVISCFQKLGMADELRQARETMSSVLPLPVEMWLEWIADEQKAAASDPAKHAEVLALYDKAHGDYLSPQLWLDHVRYAEAHADTATARGVLDRAISALGLSVRDGAQFWQLYREFEQKHAGADEDAVADKIRKLYRQELAIPLLDMDQVMSKYVTWERATSGNFATEDEAFMKNYKKALKDLEERSDFEQKLQSALEQPGSPGAPSAEALKLWRDYLALEIKQSAKKNPAMIQVLFERAVASAFLQPDLWHKYATFLMQVINIPATTLAVCERAVRNLGWSGQLWADYLIALEKSNARLDKMEEVAVRAFGNPLPGSEGVLICLAMCDYYRRRWRRNESKANVDEKDSAEEVEEASAALQERLREMFRRAQTYAATIPGEQAQHEALFTIAKYWTDLEARQLQNIEAARPIWEEVIKGNAKNYRAWLCFIDQERYCGEVHKARSLFKRSASVPSTCEYLVRISLRRAASAMGLDDNVEEIFRQWLDFEHANGTIADQDLAQQRWEKKQEELAERLAKAQQAQLEYQQQLAEAAEQQEAEQKQRKQTKRAEKKIKKKVAEQHEQQQRDAGSSSAGAGAAAAASSSSSSSADATGAAAMDVDESSAEDAKPKRGPKTKGSKKGAKAAAKPAAAAQPASDKQEAASKAEDDDESESASDSKKGAKKGSRKPKAKGKAKAGSRKKKTAGSEADGDASASDSQSQSSGKDDAGSAAMEDESDSASSSSTGRVTRSRGKAKAAPKAKVSSKKSAGKTKTRGKRKRDETEEDDAELAAALKDKADKKEADDDEEVKPSRAKRSRTTPASPKTSASPASAAKSPKPSAATAGPAARTRSRSPSPAASRTIRSTRSRTPAGKKDAAADAEAVKKEGEQSPTKSGRGGSRKKAAAGSAKGKSKAKGKGKGKGSADEDAGEKPKAADKAEDDVEMSDASSQKESTDTEASESEGGTRKSGRRGSAKKAAPKRQTKAKAAPKRGKGSRKTADKSEEEEDSSVQVKSEPADSSSKMDTSDDSSASAAASIGPSGPAPASSSAAPASSAASSLSRSQLPAAAAGPLPGFVRASALSEDGEQTNEAKPLLQSYDRAFKPPARGFKQNKSDKKPAAPAPAAPAPSSSSSSAAAATASADPMDVDEDADEGDESAAGAGAADGKQQKKEGELSKTQLKKQRIEELKQQHPHQGKRMLDEQGNPVDEEPGRIFVVNLPFRTTDDELKQLFSKFGEVKLASHITRKGKGKGYGYVTFADEKSVQPAIDAMNGQDFHGRALTVTRSTPGKAAKYDEAVDGCTLFVKKLPPSLQNAEALLKAHFTKVGFELKEVRVPRERNGELKGFAYVEYKEQAGMKAGLALNGHELLEANGAPIAKLDVQRSIPKGGRGDRQQGQRQQHQHHQSSHEQKFKEPRRHKAIALGGGAEAASSSSSSSSSAKPASAFVPRALSAAAGSSSSAPPPRRAPPPGFPGAGSSGGSSSSSSEQPADTTPKSNDDFRRMMLAGKL